ncbi:MAG TPA: glycerol-3-phosphate 1-O-acyltransferase PlsY [Isosphaeraceae bacterium]|nr:glycerol-3-phosphate 1-O-acyltransferase PlsY [Isosphaeraceae bacterium]
MNLWIQYPLGCLLGYLTGSIPFGYLVHYWVKGVDIRTLGSGNIGATNVGRNLGFRYFLLVFALDVLKGFVPTAGVPLGLKSMGIVPPADLPVFVALASILGHNFPVYLRFKGGKGVATSLGALLALDPLACGAAAVAFFLVFFPTRYVSLSSIAGALAFTAGHFAQAGQPWSKENLAMSILSLTIPALLLVRHHQNLRRILAGTEPKVPKRGSPRDDEHDPKAKPSGRIHPILLIGMTAAATFLLCGGLQLLRNVDALIEVVAGPWTLRETHRELTGQQRSTRVVFADHGRQLAVMCPRYNKVLLYDVTCRAHLDPAAEIALDGRPVAIAMAGDRLVVLERPSGDDKHLAPGWWETFTLDGKSSSPRVPAGYYPDDLAVTPDGRFLIVLNSGQAEGDKQKPLPGIDVFQVTPDSAGDSPRPVGHLSLEPEDDAERLFVSASGSRVLVTLPKVKQAVAMDLTDPEAPRPAGRTELARADAPYVSFSPDGDWIIMPTAHESEAVAIQRSASSVDDSSSPPAVAYLVYTRPDDSAVELVQASPVQTLGRFPLKGPLNLGGTRPSGLAFSADRSLLAVATKPGTVYLISLRSRLEPENGPQKDRIATTSEPTRR